MPIVLSFNRDSDQPSLMEKDYLLRSAILKWISKDGIYL